jgi:hypothetical protein
MSSTTDEKNGGITINTSPTPPTLISPASGALKPPMKMLIPADLAEVCSKIGAPPSRCRIEPTNNIPKGAKDVPSGLYKEVIAARKKAMYNYYFTATLYNSCIVLQLLFGAALTALGSSTNSSGQSVSSPPQVSLTMLTPPSGLSITILAAANTVNAGVIALLHNSGLPNRIKQDWNEYAKVEAFLEEMIYTGLVSENETKVDAVARCWDMFNTAKATIEKNKPSVYTTAPAAAALASSV